MFRHLLIAVVSLRHRWHRQRSSATSISRNNPYRSFNLSGYNYGSTQWERSHGNSTKSWSTGNTRDDFSAAGRRQIRGSGRA